MNISFFNKIYFLNVSHVFKIIFFISLIALGFAYIGEYAYGLKPCALCTYQRYLYGLTAFFAFLGLFTRKIRIAIFELFVLVILFFVNCSIAIYQVLVEQNFLSPPSICQSISTQAMSQSFEQFKKSFSQAGNHIPCNLVSFEMFGISMAGYNALFTFFCGFAFLFAFVLILKDFHQRENGLF